MNKLYLIFICATAFITLAAINVNIAHESEQNAKTTFADSLQLKNASALGNTVRRISFYYDLSGNMTTRVLLTITTSMAINTDNETIDAEIAALGSSMLKSGTAGGGGASGTFDEIPINDDVLTEMSVNAYPNPTQGILYVDIAGVDLQGGLVIEIFATSGLLVGKWTGTSSNYTIDISDKPAGIYILRVTSGKDVKTSRIVKIDAP